MPLKSKRKKPKAFSGAASAVFGIVHRLLPVISFLFILSLYALVRAERLPVKTYTVADGLLRDNVFKIKADSRGFLWFSTAEGVSRFDGYAFTNFTAADGLPDRRVNDFLETKNGTIYIATDGGMARLNPAGLAASKDNPLFTVYLPDNPKAKDFEVLFEDETGAVWAGTGGGLYKLNENGALESVKLSEAANESLVISSIVKDKRGALWIGTLDDGLFRLLPNGEAEHFTKEEGLPDIGISVLCADKNGRVWVGLRPKIVSGLVLLKDEPQKNQLIVERYFTTKDGLPADWITDLLETSDGKFLVGTIRGLCQLQPNENSVCKTYRSENNLCDTEIWSLLEDKDNNLWIGTRCGLKKWTRYGFTNYTDLGGTVSRNPDSIFENAAGELFVTFNDGDRRTISRFDGENFDLIKPKFPSEVGYFGWGNRQTVWQTAAGDWWFPTGGGLYNFPATARFEDLSKTVARKIEFGAGRKEIFKFYEDARGDFWIATTAATNELWRWERGANVWHDYSQILGIGKNRLGSAFAEDQSGNLWIGTGSSENDTALIRYRAGEFRVFTQAENNLLDGWLNDLFVDRAGRLWIANSNTGLLRLDDVNAERLNFASYTPAKGLSSVAVSCVTEDEFGRIYAGTGRGLDRLNPETGQIENFTTADGLPNSSVEIAHRDRKNNLWFGTSDGLARFVPEPQRTREPPNIFITGLRVSGVARAVSVLGETEIPTLELAADQRQIAVDFLGLGTNLGERLRYEYRFGESDWMPTTERTVNFANLAAGKYRFEVRAVTADRIYSRAPALLSFKIAAPFWVQWWFIVSVLLAASLAIYALYRFRLTRLLELERMRTRIATDLHDDIGANLTRISLLSEVAKQKSTNGNGNLLTSIADIARESVASMNDIVWAISPEHDSLADLTARMRRHAEEIFALRDVDLEFNAPVDDANLKLSVGVRRDVLLIFKEAVNNAAKHSDCSQVSIDFRCRHSVLFLRVKDDGKGFETDAESDGQGLRSMTRRARALGGKLTLEARSQNGTLVQFEMPLPKISRV